MPIFKGYRPPNYGSGHKTSLTTLAVIGLILLAAIVTGVNQSLQLLQKLGVIP